MERSHAERRFRALFDSHRRLVLGYALRRVDEPADAADVVAETFLIAWRKLGDVPEGEAARAWLLGVARRVLANQRRGERRRTGLADRLAGELAVAPLLVPSERDETVRRALAQLSESDRELILLAAWEGLSPAEIAVATGALAVTVRSRLSRARRRLRAQLSALGWEGDPATVRSIAQETVA